MFQFFYIIDIFNLNKVWFTNFTYSFDEGFFVTSKGNRTSTLFSSLGPGIYFCLQSYARSICPRITTLFSCCGVDNPISKSNKILSTHSFFDPCMLVTFTKEMFVFLSLRVGTLSFNLSFFVRLLKNSIRVFIEEKNA